MLKLITLTGILLLLSGGVNADQFLLKDDFQNANPGKAYTATPEKSWSWRGDSSKEENTSLNPPVSGVSVLNSNVLKNANSLSPGYTVKLRMRYTDLESAPARIVLLGRQIKPEDKNKELKIYGYELSPVSEKGALSLHITALYRNGKTKSIDNMSSGNWPNLDLTQWAQITAVVDIDSVSTRIRFEWEGKDKDGDTASYVVSARDSSVDRFSSGESLMLRTIKEEDDRKPGYLVDDLYVERLPIPEPVLIRPQGG